MSDDTCPMCAAKGSENVTRRARAADGAHLFPIGPSHSLRRSLCEAAILVL